MDENIIGFRGMSSEKAREVRAEGISAEKEFADLIGGKTHGSGKKKDVIDKRGDIHSVKSGEKKWQIFLYGYQRILNELDFAGANFILDCINSFPENREDYLKNKENYKNKLKIAMNNLKEFLSQGNNKLLFLKKAFLNNGEVDFLTIKHNEKFHIFDGDEVIRLIDSSTLVVNSKAKYENQFDDQKVVFKLKKENITLGEIEIRNDSDIHYREIKFWMNKKKTVKLLLENVYPSKEKIERVIVYGKAINKFRM